MKDFDCSRPQAERNHRATHRRSVPACSISRPLPNPKHRERRATEQRLANAIFGRAVQWHQVYALSQIATVMGVTTADRDPAMLFELLRQTVFFVTARRIKNLKTQSGQLTCLFAQSSTNLTVGMGNDADSALGGDLFANGGNRVAEQRLAQEQTDHVRAIGQRALFSNDDAQRGALLRQPLLVVECANHRIVIGDGDDIKPPFGRCGK